MDRATLVALLVGAGITLVTTIVTTVGGELFREWRSERRERKERQRATATKLLDAMYGLELRRHAYHGLRVKSATADEIEPIRKEMFADLGQMVILAFRLESDSLRDAVLELQSLTIDIQTVGTHEEYEGARERWEAIAQSLLGELSKLLR